MTKMLNPNQIMMAPNQQMQAMSVAQQQAQQLAPGQQMMQPQAMPQQQQYQAPAAPTMPNTPYGLAGSEQALGNWYGTAINNMQGGVTAAQQALLNQSDLGRQRLNAALGQSQGFGQQALDAVNSAGSAASGAISNGMGQVTSAFDEGVSALNQYLPKGLEAFNQVSALAGGDYSSYNESPDMQFLREQGERSVLQNARAAGGVGGNVLKELQRYGTGVASQGFNDYYNRLKGVADMGYGASQGVGSLRGQQAGIVGNLSSQQAQNAMQQGQLNASILGGMGSDALGVGQAILGERQNLGSNLASLLSGQGGAAADYAFNTGQSISGGRQQAGRDISAIQQAQGQGLSNMVGGNASNIAQLLSGVGDTINGQQGNLASILANLATNTSSTAGNQTSVAQFMKSPDYLNQLSQILGAAGAGYQYGGK